jgi:hypothetical protein
LLDDFGKLIRDVEAPLVGPTVFEPSGQLIAGLVVKDIDVKLALVREPRKRKIAGAEITGNRVVGVVGAIAQVKLGVKRVPKEELNNNLTSAKLSSESSEGCLVSGGRKADCQLVPEALGHLFLEALCRLHIDAERVFAGVDDPGEKFFRGALHSYEQPAALAILRRPVVDVLGDIFPSSKVEVSDTEIGAPTLRESSLEEGKKFELDVIYYAGHSQAPRQL